VLLGTLQTNPRLEGALEMLPVLEVPCCVAAGRGTARARVVVLATGGHRSWERGGAAGSEALDMSLWACSDIIARIARPFINEQFRFYFHVNPAGAGFSLVEIADRSGHPLPCLRRALRR
jgi:hypothetical protein